MPSVTLGRETFANSFEELQHFGDINVSLDKNLFVEKSYVDLEGVPDSMTYDSNTKEFTKSDK